MGALAGRAAARSAPQVGGSRTALSERARQASTQEPIQGADALRSRISADPSRNAAATPAARSGGPPPVWAAGLRSVRFVAGHWLRRPLPLPTSLPTCPYETVGVAALYGTARRLEGHRRPAQGRLKIVSRPCGRRVGLLEVKKTSCQSRTRTTNTPVAYTYGTTVSVPAETRTQVVSRAQEASDWHPAMVFLRTGLGNVRQAWSPMVREAQ